MDKFTSIAKGGWHPNKDSRPSSSSDQPKGLRDRAKGLMGKSSDPYEASRNHQSRPLSSLRDPASFAPPPKHYAAGGSGSTNAVVPVRSGLGAPLSQTEIEASQERQRQIEAARREEEEAARPPPGPYRVDTTGLSTSHLPPPPVRRPGSETSTPVNSSTPPTSRPALPPPAPSGAKPRLPPRLPPRQNSHPDLYAPAPPPTYQESVNTPPANPESGILNSGAINRLGKAGVSVPGFNIGRTASPPVPARASPPPRQDQNAPASSSGQLSGLQSRFSSVRLGSSSSSENTPTQGTSFAQKQAAFKTAQSFHKNPSSVSFNDMRSAASTANNFRQRHGDQVAAGMQTANGLNQKYGVLDKINGSTPPASTSTPPASTSTPPASAPPATGALGKKPPPPPPPPKRKDLGGSGGPPPLPLASKPRPGQP
ncbi:hypothetical protein IWX49DRAFT_574379 [Phyllosticta citricarpa]|uniref:Uncharacterized protein n=2 Tax=Phyllosticta TaxID=121621 RepID=A0ABR1M7N1_9PEZI